MKENLKQTLIIYRKNPNKTIQFSDNHNEKNKNQNYACLPTFFRND